MKYLFFTALIFSSTAFAFDEPCVGPGGCAPPPALGPLMLCLPEGCRGVVYSSVNRFTVAESALPNNYPVMGWSGPCLQDFCSDVQAQAFSDLEINAKRANRAQRYNEPAAATRGYLWSD